MFWSTVDCGLNWCFEQLELPGILQLRVRRFGFGRGQIGLRLVDLRLELHLLDLIEQVAGLDVLALAERDFFEKALDARAEIDLVDSLDLADEFEGLADPLHRCRPDPDRRARRRRRGLFLFIAACQ